ncbi:MAG: pyridoxal phosphate-dependent aminotransferase [bacterium]
MAFIFNSGRHGGNVISFGYKSGIIDFSANINPIGLSKKAGKIFKYPARLKYWTENYPEIYPESFIQALSDYHAISKKYIFPGAGAAGLIFNAVCIFNPSKVIIVEPSFSEYERAAAPRVGKSNIIHINTYFSEDFELKGKSLSKLLENIKKLDKNDLIFIASPSNPVGAVTPVNTIAEILKQAKAKNAFLVLDESFMDFCEEFSSKSFITDGEKFDNLIIIRSMTKFFAMPGQRIGYIFANPKIITKFVESGVPWKITSLSAEIASASLSDKDYVLTSRILLSKLKKNMERKLKKLKFFEIIPGAANFFLIKIKTGGFNAEDLRKSLNKSGILIRYCGDYRGLNDKYFRIAVKKKSENDYLIQKLKEFLSQL